MNIRIILRPICWAIGHRRGELVRTVPNMQGAPVFKVYACPRCRRERTYRVKP